MNTLDEQIKSLKQRREVYERLGKRLSVRMIDIRLQPLVAKQLRKENREDRRREHASI